jgi:ubiquinone/menaquinone biosynthesis C-methylase UbiE
MNANKALWEKGDFTQIARFMRTSGKSVVDALGIAPGMKVLDLGCGDGNTAVPIAQLGADVTGIDIAKNLVEAGNLRAKELKLANLEFQQGDACNLEGVANGTFDLTLSIFGAMFAPKPFDVAKEMVRVTKSGGRVVMGNWIPNDPTFVSQVLKISSAFTPPPPEGFVSPMLWGVESNVIERFGAAGIPPQHITTTRETFLFDSHEKTPQQFIDLFREFYGPTMNAFEAATKNGKEQDLYQQLVTLANAQNQSKDGGTYIPATFLKVTVNV